MNHQSQKLHTQYVQEPWGEKQKKGKKLSKFIACNELKNLLARELKDFSV